MGLAGLLEHACLPAASSLSLSHSHLILNPSHSHPRTNCDYYCYCTTRCGHGNTKPLLASCVVALESAACRTQKVSATPPCAARPNLPYIGSRHAAMEISQEGRCDACCVMRKGTSPSCREAFFPHLLIVFSQRARHRGPVHSVALRVGGKKKTTKTTMV